MLAINVGRTASGALVGPHLAWRTRGQNRAACASVVHVDSVSDNVGIPAAWREASTAAKCKD